MPTLTTTRRNRLAPLLLITAAILVTTSHAAAGESAETITGKTLSIVRSEQNVTVMQDGRELLCYVYARALNGPYISGLTSPGGANILSEEGAGPHAPGLTFGMDVDGVKFSKGTGDLGTQVHEKWNELRIDEAAGVERAVLDEHLVWETPEGDYLLQERRTLTVPALAAGQPRMLVWQSAFTPGEDAIDTLSLGGTEPCGLGLCFRDDLSGDGRNFTVLGDVVEETAGPRAAWAARTAKLGAGQSVTVAMFDAPTNPRHPPEWFVAGRDQPVACMADTLGLGTEPLKLELGKTVTACFGVAVFDTAADTAEVNASYLKWYQLQAAARRGLAPGLLGQYFSGKSTDTPACVRIDPNIAFDWSSGMPDDRLRAGPFSATWTGQVRVDREGHYRFSLNAVRSEGSVWVDGQLVDDPNSAAEGQSIALDFGYHPVRVELAASAPDAAAALTWESEHFPPETINARYLAHDAADEAPHVMDLLHDPGRAVFERYGCARCHATPGVAPGRRPGPPLVPSSRAEPEYLSRWLANPQAVRSGTAMPALAGDAESVAAAVPVIVAFLKSLPPPTQITSLPEVGGGEADREQLTQKGRERFYQLGCAACHAPENPDEADAALAPSLADVGVKWPEPVLREFLSAPLEAHPEGGMPDFALKPIDAARLAAYLSTFDGSDFGSLRDSGVSKTPEVFSVNRRFRGSAATSSSRLPAAGVTHDDLIAQGEQFVKTHRCAACHEIPGIELPDDAAPPLGPGSSAMAGCLQTDAAAGSSPRFALKPTDRLTLREFLARRPVEPATVAAQEMAERAIRHQWQCLRCHLRNGEGGEALSRAVLQYSGEGGETDQVALTAPEISGVGARLRREWLLKTLEGNPPSPRPWLKVRMPRFALTDNERSGIADRLATADAMEHLKAPRPHELPATLDATAGHLLNPEGFSCINCHYIGSRPSTSETSAPDLNMITRRVSRDWFHRWLANPARIIPNTPMPAFITPATEIADEDLLVQKETVWQFLKHAPPATLRNVVTGGTTAVEVAGLRPSVVQGRIEGFAHLVRGIAVGLNNQNSLVFDYERVAWRGSWKGGFLNEAGRHGAQHWWEPVGAATWISHDNSPPILFRQQATGQWMGPALWRERFGFVDRVTLVGRAVRLEYRVRAPGPRTGSHEPESWLHVTELIEPNPPGDEADGVTRSLEVTGLPDGYDLVLQQSLGGENRKAFVGETPYEQLPKDIKGPPLAEAPTLNVQETAGRQWVMRLGGHPSARWIAPPESITYPVEQPRTDDLPLNPANRFDPVVQPGGGRVAVVVPHPGDGRSVNLVWQTAEVIAGGKVASGPPARWEAPPENVPLQDLKKRHYLTYPVDVDRLGQSAALRLPPGFQVERLPLEEQFLVCGLNFYRGKLLVGGYDGQLRIADDTDEDGLPDSYRYFGGTLQQITNLRVYDGEIYVTAPGAVYRIRDLNDDEVADEYQLLSSLWDCSAHQNDWFFGLTRDEQGNLYGANSTPFIYRPGGQPPGYYLRGDVLKITPSGQTIKVGTGTRFQFGWAENLAGRMYFNINQGHYNYTNGIHQVVEGAHYGFLEPDLSKVQMPVVRHPYPWCKSLNGMDFAESPVPFGPFQDHGFSADYNTNQVIRWTDYAIGDQRQGACYPFFQGTDAGPTEIVFGPDGALYVGFMCDQGWYGGQARGGIYKVTYVGPPPLTIREARVTKDGFAVELTDRVDPASVSLDVCPKVHRWWHENKGTYASPEIAHEDVPVRQITLSDDRRTLQLHIESHVTPRLYRVELKGLRTSRGQELTGGLVYLTVHWLPGEVTEPKSNW